MVGSTPSRPRSSPNDLTSPSVTTTSSPAMCTSSGVGRSYPGGWRVKRSVRRRGHPVRMHRTLSARLGATLVTPTDVVLAVAIHPSLEPAGAVTATLDGAPVTLREVLDDNGGVLHCADRLGPGELLVSYAASVVDRAAPLAPSEFDPIRYLRPSRYAE